jgi:hypothetical protein
MTSFFYVVSVTFHTSVPALRKCMDTSRKRFFWLRAQPIVNHPLHFSSDLMSFMNFLVLSYTCCSDRHASSYWTFICRWISMGFTPSVLKKRMTEHCSFWCMLQAGPPLLHYYCAVVLHSCIVLPPVGHSSNHEYHCCQLTIRSSCVSNSYRTFKVFIWLSLVKKHWKMSSASDWLLHLQTHL